MMLETLIETIVVFLEACVLGEECHFYSEVVFLTTLWFVQRFTIQLDTSMILFLPKTQLKSVLLIILL